MYLLGIDIGSSSVKVALLEAETGICTGSIFHPQDEMPILAVQAGWAEQHPALWWENLQIATAKLLAQTGVEKSAIKAIGISYQMHGLVLVDENHEVLRPSIIWCDSRAASIGDQAFEALGSEACLSTLLNSPGNFTASKLRWVKENEPELFAKVKHWLLPGDYIALKLTGLPRTTISGLSEGVFWDFKNKTAAQTLLEHYGIPPEMLPETVPTFGFQGALSSEAAEQLGLATGTPISYRAGDQPNNAFSLNVLRPGEVAATAGTSGVVYSVTDQVNYDPFSRVNTFAHVNYSTVDPRLGILLCINGCGILNAWMRRNTGLTSYEAMNELAAAVPIGSEGLRVLPFGNGAERVLRNQDMSAQIQGLHFNIHDRGHLIRAGQEGIAFSLYYGMEIMQAMGTNLSVIRAAEANLFLSPIFRETLAALSGSHIELYNTDGALGAARGAGIGVGIYASAEEAFANLKTVREVSPEAIDGAAVREAYVSWKGGLDEG